MNQPDLGLKVTEVRQQKGFTQEQLAEHCEVSTRTIQRIESGEVEPRPFTRNSLSNTLDFDFNESNVHNEPLWLAALHLSSIFSIIIIPLLIWSWKKKQSYKIDRHGRDVLNFQITINLMLIAVTVFLVFGVPFIILASETHWNINDVALGVLPLISIVPMIAIGIFCTWQGVVNTVRVMSDKPYKYPLSIPFIK
ncbi:MAG: helix-turn-helix domain-containing protein [Anaerolineaceae bacterium]|nr:helix-turn-helix domain-containing protein [Anaerolineaceae bacterium]